MEWHQFDKRIGKRRQVRSIPMAWVRNPAEPDRDAADHAPDGSIVELSVTGAGLVARTHPNLRVGATVLIVAHGTVGKVVVRRIEADRYPGESYYGVEFTDAHAELPRALQRSFQTRSAPSASTYLPRT